MHDLRLGQVKKLMLNTFIFCPPEGTHGLQTFMHDILMYFYEFNDLQAFFI